jgi:hypothetical protein
MDKHQKKVTILLNGKPFEVPPGGALGVLALGNIGVRAWKKAKEEFHPYPCA